MVFRGNAAFLVHLTKIFNLILNMHQMGFKFIRIKSNHLSARFGLKSKTNSTYVFYRYLLYQSDYVVKIMTNSAPFLRQIRWLIPG